MNFPSKQKYIDEIVGTYFIFGSYPGTDRVDVSDGNGDVFYNIKRSTALKIIKAQETFRETLYSIQDDPI